MRTFAVVLKMPVLLCIFYFYFFGIASLFKDKPDGRTYANMIPCQLRRQAPRLPMSKSTSVKVKYAKDARHTG